MARLLNRRRATASSGLRKTTALQGLEVLPQEVRLLRVRRLALDRGPG